MDHQFVKEGIRQQRKQAFNYPLLEKGTINVINSSMENVVVNGLPNASISEKIVPNRIETHSNAMLQEVEHPDFSYIKIDINTYIGNPK